MKNNFIELILDNLSIITVNVNYIVMLRPSPEDEKDSNKLSYVTIAHNGLDTHYNGGDTLAYIPIEYPLSEDYKDVLKKIRGCNG